MWVKDPKKTAQQGYIRADIGSNITNTRAMAGKVRDILNGVIMIIGTEPESELISDCRIAIKQFEEAERRLNACSALVNKLNTDKWVDDDNY